MITDSINMYTTEDIMSYKLKHYLGDTIHEGTLKECEMILKSFAKYGIADRKFEIECPEHDDFKFSESTKDKVFSYVRDMWVDGRYDCGDYISDTVEYELGEMTDRELLEELEQVIDEEDDECVKAKAEFNSFIADNIILE